MNITDIRIRRVNAAGRMKAVVSVTFDDQFVVHDIKVVEGNNGYFVAMPSRKGADGEFRDVAHPITTETRNLIQTAILDKYNNEILEEA
ncbi:MAG: septation regulator SpoVG [Firmicutes bacterium]|nr:septation regulator SpoVG [Bacillota bacterium]